MILWIKSKRPALIVGYQHAFLPIRCVSLDKSGNPPLVGSGTFLVAQWATSSPTLANNLGTWVWTWYRLRNHRCSFDYLAHLGLHQSRGAAYQAAKREYLAPILEPINERLRNAETQKKKDGCPIWTHAGSTWKWCQLDGGVGCLPLLIQLPFSSQLPTMLLVTLLV